MNQKNLPCMEVDDLFGQAIHMQETHIEEGGCDQIMARTNLFKLGPKW